MFPASCVTDITQKKEHGDSEKEKVFIGSITNLYTRTVKVYQFLKPYKDRVKRKDDRVKRKDIIASGASLQMALLEK